MSSNSYLSFRKRFEHVNTGKKSNFLDDLIPSGSTITLNKDFVPKKNSLESPFKEIRVLPPEEVYDYNALHRYIGLSRKRAFDPQAFLGFLERFINVHWNRNGDKFHIVLHSSGYDSRIISHFLRKAYNKRPVDIALVCMFPEVKAFEKIMEYEGWDASQCYTYDRSRNPWRLGLNFEDAWEQVNGPAVLPINWSYCCIQYLRRRRVIPKDRDIVIWSGSHLNEMFIYKGVVDEYIRRRYLHNHSHMWGLAGNAVTPATSVDLVREVYQSQPVGDIWKVRLGMLKRLDPKLAALPRSVNPDMDVALKLKRSVYDRMRDAYRQSFYASQLPMRTAPDEIPMLYEGYERFWSRWTAASFIEHLHHKDVEIVL